MACAPDAARAMHQDALLLAICANKKWQDAIGEEVWVGELEILDRRPADVLRPKTALVGIQQIISIIGELFWREQADDLLDGLVLHKIKPLIECLTRYVCEGKPRAARTKDDVLSIGRSTKAALWICHVF